MKEHCSVLLDRLEKELISRGDSTALIAMISARSKSDRSFALRLEEWLCDPSTIVLREICAPFSKRWSELAFFNLVHAIDAASLPVLRPEGKTPRSFEFRLFPHIDIPGQHHEVSWRISAQAGVGYASTPKIDLPFLEDYDTVEVVIFNDALPGGLVDPQTLPLSVELKAKFTPIETGAMDTTPAIGCHIPMTELETIRKALLQANQDMNWGAARGALMWSGVPVYQGASMAGARDMQRHGPLPQTPQETEAQAPSAKLGRGIYLTTDPDLAISDARAPFCRGKEAIVTFAIGDEPGILDLRNAEDRKLWSSVSSDVDHPDFDSIARAKGIMGVYDPKLEALVIYDPSILSFISSTPTREPEEHPPF